MRTLAARPDASVGHEPGGEEALDAGPGEMHPPDAGMLLEDRRQLTRPRPVHPHQALGVLDRHDAAARADDSFGGLGPVRDNSHARLGSTHEPGSYDDDREPTVAPTGAETISPTQPREP